MIETISIDQLGQIEPLWVRLNSLHRDLDETCGKPRRDTTWEQRYRQFLEKAQGKCLIQIVKSEFEAAGYCFTSIDHENKGEIDSIFLDPEWRGRGLGKELMQNALDWLKKEGCEEIKLSVHPGNTEAIAFYRSLGFANEPVMKKVTDGSLRRPAIDAGEFKPG